MQLDDLINQTGEWLRGEGPYSEIVISSRVRLARNLDRMPFSQWANKKQKEEILKKCKEAIDASDYMKGQLFLYMDKLDVLDRQFLVERHLMSREHAINPFSKALVVSEREIISIMINEEDHLRLQALYSGFNLLEAYRLVEAVDQQLANKLDSAYSMDLGYLTACPTNVGTGTRASCMLHLPSLVITKQINKVLHAITKLGLTARGLFGEGTEAIGNFFQISNQVTLGLSEEEILDNLERLIRQVIEQEVNARKALMSHHKEELEDNIWRAYGTIKSAHIITSDETINLLSSVRLGSELGIITDINRKNINELFILIQPAHLQKIVGKTLTSAERDVKRAEIIQDKLKQGG